eukprot:CAMPEP_0174251340 /NCGR_PEP_ID=MMETSP0439-20130205/1187_1 /TAXON_ID=0 /ORGANISM="Stereomyxa ramosa, Strain Chinc5" /LENGTH=725 /DNA_ID=CAMNT_0015331621 /DNA_START=35 /DNA_END=2209 /DNA_ORIENTATION=+
MTLHSPSFATKLSSLSPFSLPFFHDIRTDLQNEHLKNDDNFVKCYFPTHFKKDFSELSDKEIAKGYLTAIGTEEKTVGEELALKISEMWLLHHFAIYQFFEDSFLLLGIDYENQQVELSEEVSKSLVEEPISKFGAVDVHIFVTINSVLLNKKIKKEVLERAEGEMSKDIVPYEGKRGRESWEDEIGEEMKCLRLSNKFPNLPSIPKLRRSQTVSGIGNLKMSSSDTECENEIGKGEERTGNKVSKTNSFIIHNKDRKIRSVEQSGFLSKLSHKSTKHSASKIWKKRYVILKHSTLYYYKSKPPLPLSSHGINSDANIPLLYVTFIRTAPQYGSSAFVIGTITREFYFRAPSSEMFKHWLFSFHCSLAKIVEDMLSPMAHKRRLNAMKTERWWRQTLNPLHFSNSSDCPYHIEVQEYQKSECFVTIVASTQGQRKRMEDEYIVETSLNEKFGIGEKIPPTSCFGVFDGHGGSECSKYLKDYLLQNIVHQFLAIHPHDIRDAIPTAFQKTDQDFTKIALENELWCGSTAIVMFLQADRVIVANVGDSRAVLCDGNGTATGLSIDHKPGRESERRRIEEAGGWIVTTKELNIASLYQLNPELINEEHIPQQLAQLVGFVTSHRLCGELSVSRAFGDVEYKGDFKNEFWGKEFSSDLVISEPEVHYDILSAADKFIIIACDGLWDVLSDQEAVDWVLNTMAECHNPRAVCEGLVEEALNRGSTDNITC